MGQPRRSPQTDVMKRCTGFVWLQNADCFRRQPWDQAKSSAASLKSGSCGLTDGSTAGKWRLPTRDEFIARKNDLQGFNSVQGVYPSIGLAVPTPTMIPSLGLCTCATASCLTVIRLSFNPATLLLLNIVGVVPCLC